MTGQRDDDARKYDPVFMDDGIPPSDRIRQLADRFRSRSRSDQFPDGNYRLAMVHAAELADQLADDLSGAKS